MKKKLRVEYHFSTEQNQWGRMVKMAISLVNL